TPVSLTFPYTTLFRSVFGERSCGDLQRQRKPLLAEAHRHRDGRDVGHAERVGADAAQEHLAAHVLLARHGLAGRLDEARGIEARSEEHTSELQSRENL